MRILRPSFVSFVLVPSALVSGACTGDLDHPSARVTVTAGEDGGAATPASATEISQVEIVRGVPSRGRDPAVVAVEIAGSGLCTGTLVAENVVLTARHCVARTRDFIQCPPTSAQVGEPRAAGDLRILRGDDASIGEEVGRGVEIVTTPGNQLCDEDIAFVVLDRAVTGIVPLALHLEPLAKGQRIRSVGFGRRGDEQNAGMKLVREHVPIVAVSTDEFQVGEATCQGDSGGPAVDEDSGDIVGVVSRGGPACEGKDVHNIYTRVDVYRDLFQDALERAAARRPKDAGAAKPPATGSSKKPPTDMGEKCSAGADCASGVCVGSGAAAYCSRSCGGGDRCPNGYHCKSFKRDKAAPISACTRIN